jgi:hypothetical protein
MQMTGDSRNAASNEAIHSKMMGRVVKYSLRGFVLVPYPNISETFQYFDNVVDKYIKSYKERYRIKETSYLYPCDRTTIMMDILRSGEYTAERFLEL